MVARVIVELINQEITVSLFCFLTSRAEVTPLQVCSTGRYFRKDFVWY